MARITIERLVSQGSQFIEALEHYNRFVQTGATTNIPPYKGTEISLISQEPGKDNFLEFTLEYENPLDLLLLGHAVGCVMTEAALRPHLREGVRDGR
jgi:hypothetical protein